MIKKEEIDLLSRMMSMQKAHPSYAMTGAMCTAAAAVVPGSIVEQILKKGCRYTVSAVLVMQAGPLNVAWITEKKGAKR